MDIEGIPVFYEHLTCPGDVEVHQGLLCHVEGWEKDLWSAVLFDMDVCPWADPQVLSDHEFSWVLA